MKRIVIFGISIVAIILMILLGQKTMIINSGSIYAKLNSFDKYVLYEGSSGTCKEEEEVIFEDDEYKYYFTCEKSDMYLIHNGSKYFTIDEGLEEEYITINYVYYLLQGELKRITIEEEN